MYVGGWMCVRICVCRGGVEGPAGTANAVPFFTVVRIATPNARLYRACV